MQNSISRIASSYAAKPQNVDKFCRQTLFINLREYRVLLKRTRRNLQLLAKFLIFLYEILCGNLQDLSALILYF